MTVEQKAVRRRADPGSTAAVVNGHSPTTSVTRGRRPSPPSRSTPSANRAAPIEQLGKRIRAARVRKGLGVRELARKVECSASLISQIEIGTSNPSVSTLYAISTALGITMDSLIIGSSDDDAGLLTDPTLPVSRAIGTTSDNSPLRNLVRDQRRIPVFLRAGERRVINLEHGVRWELLSPIPESNAEFMEVTYQGHGGSNAHEHAIRHNGREYCVILEGALSVQVGFEQFVLRPGDSMAFESTIPHRFWNDGDTPVRAVWFVIDRW